MLVSLHTMYGETEQELLQNAKKHGIEVHGYTEETATMKRNGQYNMIGSEFDNNNRLLLLCLSISQ